MFDVLNHYIMDTIIEKYDYSERKMADEHFKTIKKLRLKYPIIRTGVNVNTKMYKKGNLFMNKKRNEIVHLI